MEKVLAIETSCDDTSVAIVNYDGKFIKTEKSVSYSQIKEHKKFGGVVPEIASRLHNEKIIGILESIGKDNIVKCDKIVVTANPGLPGSLIIGKTVANILGEYYGKEIIYENHIHGHIFSILLGRDIDKINLPIAILTASGGHNDIYILSKNDNKFNLEHIGMTLDDASGECFDKCARMLGGPYPGGAWISKIAKDGKNDDDLKIGPIYLKQNEYKYSFSGIKSKVYYAIKQIEEKYGSLSDQDIKNIAYMTQEAIVKSLGKKIIQACLEYECKTLSIVGGVSANDRLIEYIQNKTKKYNIDVIRPIKKEYSTDNADMIGASYLGKKYYFNLSLIN
ncbi:tRNA (adenosine(37)-N6)-threonylcarbamoyltransferase complex transferase subunit TsaD [Candidatus Vampirococcus lugosii]|uniref:N(6)-L-threonylcarbamoyladenine synthase n=1 Tax=Candidatus Vampirococcus lugosii TaxID=2789015 RepID=A0ABS5QLI6_9BACT|nr:tRNA (adenosine(37)-N6)-threonylcarbamoyltransferase complex transferase subunit TsaD [Candidatus Vampirococcus lugosii]MBS8121643.1 tRNA threonylcarbamoyladenosine modification protein TsaD [Candidatus Vampirococcus lugosii]